MHAGRLSPRFPSEKIGVSSNFSKHSLCLQQTGIVESEEAALTTLVA